MLKTPTSAPTSVLQQMLRKKVITKPDADSGDHLARTISTFQLTMFGVGATIGTGIFVILGDLVPATGPGIIISFIICGIVAGLTAMCYAEIASAIPVSGSSYSYAYASMGEIVAFSVGAFLLLEYGVSAAAVAIGWGTYLNELFDLILGGGLPHALVTPPILRDPAPGDKAGIINLPAVVLISSCTFLLLRGASESAKANAIMVVVKVVVLAIFVVIALTAFNADHFANFAPAGTHGITAAAGVIFFTYVGLDAVSTAAEEAENPQKALPRAIIAALFIVTAAYILVAVAGIGARPAAEFESGDAVLADIAKTVTGMSAPAILIAAGAVVSVFSVTLVVLYGQTRILFAMSRDGMLPEFFSKVNSSTFVPVRTTIVVGLIAGTIAGFVDQNFLWDFVSIGTLAAFIVVSAAVLILRRTEPDLPRGFKVPLYPFLPILSIAACIYMITTLQVNTLVIFCVWMAIALTFYFTYSRHHSRLGEAEAATTTGTPS